MIIKWKKERKKFHLSVVALLVVVWIRRRWSEKLKNMHSTHDCLSSLGLSFGFVVLGWEWNTFGGSNIICKTGFWKILTTMFGLAEGDQRNSWVYFIFWWLIVHKNEGQRRESSLNNNFTHLLINKSSLSDYFFNLLSYHHRPLILTLKLNFTSDKE